MIFKTVILVSSSYLTSRIRELISGQSDNSEPTRQSYQSGTDPFYDKYRTFPAIKKHLAYLKSKYKDLVSIVTLGKSYEKRPLYMIKLSSTTGTSRRRNIRKTKHRGRFKKKRSVGSKSIIWLDAGHHAREWVSHSTCIYIMQTLLEDYTSGNIDVANAFDKYDFYIMPVVNPDGYQYSHMHDRLWRKTRSKQKRSCYGVDPNRNYPVKWATAGASIDPCSEIFAGPHALSEPETIALANTIVKYKNQIKLYLSLHAYSQVMLSPWGHKPIRPSNYAELESLAKVAMKAIEEPYGTRYRFGTSSQVMCM